VTTDDHLVFVRSGRHLDSVVASYETMGVSLNYDADKQAFKVRVNWGDHGTVMDPTGHGLAFDQQTEPHEFTWDLPVSRERALDVKLGGTVLLICRLSKPWLQSADLFLRIYVVLDVRVLAGLPRSQFLTHPILSRPRRVPVS
jgi:hypothetical protein